MAPARRSRVTRFGTGLALLLCTCAAAVEPPPAVAPAPAAPVVEAAAAPVAEAGCPATTAALPPDPRVSAQDPRLQGQALVVVFKGARRVGVYRGGALAQTAAQEPACWRMALAYDPSAADAGPKERQGDLRTPEGWYRSSDKPWSQFYGAIAVHYPNADDAARGLAEGLITQAQHDAILRALARDQKPPQETRLGGEILLHGGGSLIGWTLGCVALDNPDLDALRALLPSTLRTDVLLLP